MDEHLSLMSVHAKPSPPGETDVDAREVDGWCAAERRAEGREKKEKSGEDRK